MLKMNIDISVIVPVYNVEKYIEKCISTLVKQDCRNIEFIIVNDGSKDSSVSICENMISGDMRFRIIHKENGGLMSAWKLGVKEAKGRYIGFVDSDDWVDSDMFSKLLDKIITTGADIVCSGYIAESEGTSVRVGRDKEYTYSGEEIKKDFIREYCCSYFRNTCHPTICRWDKLYKKELIISNMQYFNEKVSMGEDFNVNIAMLLDARKVVLMGNFTPYHYRNNPNSIVNTLNPKAFDNIVELSKVCGTIVCDKRADSLYIDSFIGNMIFEEVNKVCKSKQLDNEAKKEFGSKLKNCNASYFISRYARVRNKKYLDAYLWAIKHSFIGLIKWMNYGYGVLQRCKR